MPSTKRKATYDKADSFIASDTGSPPPAKSAKRSRTPTESSTSNNKASAFKITYGTNSKMPVRETDSDGNPYWSISTARRVTISDYRGKKMINIREYYQKDGEWLPGKKGITMTIEQYSEFIKCLPGIEEALGKEVGESVGRPDYGVGIGKQNGHAEGNNANDDDQEDEDGDDGERRRKSKISGRVKDRKGRKANIEATSDEEESDEEDQDEG